MGDLVISEIQILPVKPNNGLIAFISFVINNQFYVGNVALYTSPSSADGYRLVYPIKMLPNGKEIHCVHPINRETGEQVKGIIVAKYQEIMDQFNRI